MAEFFSSVTVLHEVFLTVNYLMIIQYPMLFVTGNAITMLFSSIIIHYEKDIINYGDVLTLSLSVSAYSLHYFGVCYVLYKLEYAFANA